MSELTLHNLTINKKSRKNPKRLGRGNASGHGTYSTRGQKGQKARSGGSKGLRRWALVQQLRSKPKIGGFRSLRPKSATVNVSQLESNFAAGEIVNAKKLIEKNLIKSAKTGIKILGEGRLTKKLTVFADSFSKSAESAIIKAGGKAQKTR
ncbi:MAG: 50S ribosomal protein L15 [Candidatus Buchananbacteria bacterium RIFCSPHIGHO2_02_FULL_45_11b]|uniref:Large ribosomal subunit protein uL15 n=4 Tax=Candidatus Buchananiibacteriota TaxID=1817903 RepID=A0A1G1Y5D4_9BACT|nr:MAG: 50S ribosomal protein L15 [Candidatus Buchananbacteria bacterium RIFCSPHIGHO2_01_FULL_46_12]OGY50486.1 MAG: 50S ribosomal protein L15 [Candidatus Buchananbacteria bacterium RIFCSPHIGHO2_02_FULL_45_11b]OGY53464.1 MAG: 50S ribosomal protein L15 [Candidatus Buchananbacteria bacterium RIFCSPLOWO2_01_FULL_45_31]OGY57063.1 MAG: 50S ribosomal protein L15 [Candidatus Buchananbacteria bacterium RIFCSPLOWO2_02_FULL_46_11b]